MKAGLGLKLIRKKRKFYNWEHGRRKKKQIFNLKVKLSYWGYFGENAEMANWKNLPGKIERTLQIW